MFITNNERYLPCFNYDTLLVLTIYTLLLSFNVLADEPDQGHFSEQFHEHSPLSKLPATSIANTTTNVTANITTDNAEPKPIPVIPNPPPMNTVNSKKAISEPLQNRELASANYASIHEHKGINEFSYHRILNATSKNYLWFTQGKLSFAAMNLIELVEDLGWVEANTLYAHNGLSINDKVIFDQQLTELLYKVSQFVLQSKKTAGWQPSAKKLLLNKPLLAGITNTQTASSIESTTHGDLINFQAILVNAVKHNRLDELLDSLIPKYEQVALLRQEIKALRQTQHRPWPRLAKSFQVELGQQHPQVAILTELLIRYKALHKADLDEAQRDVLDPIKITA